MADRESPQVNGDEGYTCKTWGILLVFVVPVLVACGYFLFVIAAVMLVHFGGPLP